MSALVVALTVLAVSLPAFLGHRLLAAAVDRLDEPVPLLRALYLVGVPATGLVTWAALALAGLDAAARGAVGGGPAGDLAPALAAPPLGGLVAGLAYAVLAPVPMLAAYLGVFPAVRRARGLEMTGWAAAGQFYRYAAVVLALVAVVHRALTWAATTGRVAAAALLGTPLGIAALLWGSPLVLRAVGPTRSPDDAEHARLDRLCERVGFDPAGTLVRGTDGAETAGTWLRGLPRRRHLLVTDHFLAALAEEDAAALLASGVARARLLYLEYRLGTLAVLLALALLALGEAVPPWAPLAYLLALPGLHLVGYRLVYRADDRAAERVSAETLADAFERFAELHDHGGGNRLYGLAVMRPPLERRIRRLRER